MKINLNSELTQFFDRCLNNINSSKKNNFIGLKISRFNETAILKKLNKLGSKQTSLYLSTKTFLNAPYHKNISLSEIKDNVFTYRKEKVSANYLFNYDVVQFDPNKELNDTLILKAMDEDYEAVCLRQNGNVWMMDAPSEAQTIDLYAQKAHGSVVTFGLGIGYFPFMCLLNPNVSKITIIEYSLPVIAMFNKYILPQFNDNHKIEIIHGDAYKYFNADYLNSFDYIFVDIYQSSDDGYRVIEKMLNMYIPEQHKLDFWIEDSCFEFMPALILLYFINYSGYKHIKIASSFQRSYHKICKYFKSIDLTIDDYNDLKELMYDRSVLRKIASL